MIASVIFVIALLSNGGELQMKAVELDKCPDASSFTETMDKYKTEKLLKEWNAICIPQGQNT